MRGLRFALVAALLLLPAGAAQFPFPPPATCDGLVIRSLTVPGELSAGEIGKAGVTIRNNGSIAMDVRVSMEILAGGWGGEETDKTRAALAPGEEATLQFDVAPTGGAEPEAIVTVTAQGTCATAPAGCPDDVCRTREATISQATRLRAESGVAIPFLGGVELSLPLVVASALVIAGLAATPFALARRRPRGLDASCPEPLKLVRPGRGASFPIEIRNPAPAPTTATLDVSAVPEGWSAFLPLPDVQLAARESRSLFLMVRAPPEAQPGETIDVEMTVRDAARPDRPHFVRVRAEVHSDASDAEA